MSNNNTNSVSAVRIVNRCAKSQAFKIGYESILHDKPFDYNLADGWYDRGRVFAIWSQHNNAPRAAWRNSVLSKAAQDRLLRCCYSGYLR